MKPVLSTLSLSLIALGLSACGGSDNSAPTPASAPTLIPAPTPVPTPTPAPQTSQTTTPANTNITTTPTPSPTPSPAPTPNPVPAPTLPTPTPSPTPAPNPAPNPVPTPTPAPTPTPNPVPAPNPAPAPALPALKAPTEPPAQTQKMDNFTFVPENRSLRNRSGVMSILNSNIRDRVGYDKTPSNFKDLPSKLNGVEYSHDNIDLTQLPLGFSQFEHVEGFTFDVADKPHSYVNTTNYHLYHQPNSIVLGRLFAKKIDGELYTEELNYAFTISDDGLIGNATAVLPTAGIYDYTGVSFTHNKTGEFSYSIDFDKKLGKGAIAIDNKNITLDEASISQFGTTDSTTRKTIFDDNQFGIKGTTSGDAQGSYTLRMFGDNALEVAGYLSHFSTQGIEDIGFSGKR